MGEVILKSPSRANDIEVSDLGKPDTLRYNVLTMVINEEYDRAVKTLREYLDSDSPFPNFKMRTERYILHCVDLIYAIRAKRNFPGLSALTRTKQQELKDKFKDHFSELRFTIKKVEDCVEELRIVDVRSTSLVVKSVWYSIVVVFLAGLFLEIIRGLGYTAEVVISEYVDYAVNLLFDKIL